MSAKPFLTSGLILGLVVSPAIGDTLYNNDIVNSCNVDILGSSSGNATNSFTAQYAPNKYTSAPGTYLLFNNNTISENQTCPIGSYCPGFTNQDFTDSTMGLNTCPTNYTSDSGASAQNQCYQTCSVSCTQPTAPAHSTNVTYGTETASGRTYYGSSCNAIVPTCSINFDCVTGYHKVGGGMSYPLSDLASVASVEVSVVQQLFPGKTTVTEDEIKATLTPQLISMFVSDYAEYLSSEGLTHDQYVQTQILNTLTVMANGRAGMESVLGISGDNITVDGDHKYAHDLDGNCSEDGSWHVCSPEERANSLSIGNFEVDFSYGTVKGQALCSTTGGSYAVSGNPIVSDDGGQNCWCQMTGFTPTNGTLQSLSSAWVFHGGYSSASNCAYTCADLCAGDVDDLANFRGALFGGLGATAPQAPAECVANDITVTWNPNNGQPSSTNTCTYGGDITLPTAPTKAGYTFSGWKLVTPSAQ